MSLICLSSAQAQNQPRIDSLLQVISSGVSDKEFVDTHVKVAFEYMSFDSLETAKYAQLAIEKANRIDYQEGELNALFCIAWVNMRFLHYAKAEELYKKIIRGAKKIDHKKGLIQGHNGLGALYASQGSYKKALTYFFKALEFFKELNNKHEMIACYINIGIAYKSLGNLNESLEYNFKALELAKEVDDQRKIAIIYNGIAGIYNQQENIEEALDYCHKALKIFEEIEDNLWTAGMYSNIGTILCLQSDCQQGLDYFYKALAIQKELGDDVGVSDCYTHIGGSYEMLKDYKKALEFYNKSLKARKKAGNSAELGLTLLGIGKVYLKQKKLLEAKKYLSEAVSIAREKRQASVLRDAAQNLSTVEKELNNYKSAYEYYVLFKEMTDSLSNEEQTKKVTRLEAEYKFQQEKDSIQLANNAERQLLKKDVEKKGLLQVFMLTVLVLVGSLLLVAFLFLRTKTRANKELTEKSRQLMLKNNEIEAQSEKITHLNCILKQNLDEATEDLLFKNQKLSEYAYYNSHETRAPICQLLGLTNIINTDNVDEETALILKNIKISAVKLDIITKKMNKVLEETNFFKDSHLK